VLELGNPDPKEENKHGRTHRLVMEFALLVLRLREQNGCCMFHVMQQISVTKYIV